MSNDPKVGRSRLKDAVYEILKPPDGSFDIFHNGELIDRSVPGRWLADQLAKHGICVQEYRDARPKLDELGEARFVFRAG